MRLPHYSTVCVSGAMLFLAFACANGHSPQMDDDDASLAALSASQKSQLKSTTDAFNAIEVQAARAGTPSPTPSLMPSPSPAPSPSPSSAAELTEANQAGPCTVVTNPPEASATGPINTFSYTVNGNGCPITFDHELNLKFDASGLNASGTLDYDYSVHNEVFGEQNDVDRVTLKGPISIGAGETKIDATGSLHSRTQGDIAISVHNQVDSKNGIVRVRYDFPGFSAALRAATRRGQTTYFLNCEKISQEEFETYLPAVTTTALDGSS
jgi:hypothetical protein